jgi:hypothetical protein
MSPKSINFNPNPRNKPQPDTNALDAFVNGEAMQSHKEASIEKKPIKRLTFDIDGGLHKRIRMTCLERGKDMAEELRRILEENFPK